MSQVIKKAKKTPRWKKALGGGFYVIVCVIALALGTGAQWVSRSPILWEGLKGSVGLGETPESLFRDQMTVLVLGCDEDRAYGGKKILRQYARSDMMMVAKIDFKTKSIGAVSIARDLEVELPGYRPQKINAYHSIGGKELAKQAAEQVVGIPIDRVVVINYDAFQKMVDAAGGVTLYVPKRMVYHDRRGGLHVDLQPGRQKLKGYEAMGFVRFRHDALSDFARQDRQKDFMLAFKEQMKKNWTSAPEVTNRAEEVMNGAFDSKELATLALWLKDVPNDNIKMGAVPTLPGRGSNLELDRAKLPEVLAANNLIEPLADTSPRISRR